MRGIVLIGMKSSGKTTTGKALAERLGADFIDMDVMIEREHARRKGERLKFREIFKRYGKDHFRALETAALRALSVESKGHSFVLATGGGLPLVEENRVILKEMGTVIFLDVPRNELLPRIVAGGIPAFFPYPEDPEKSLDELLTQRRPVYEGLANLVVDCGNKSPFLLADEIVRLLERNTHDH